jgi:hypothetical protein
MKKQVVLADVLGWLREAMLAAKADPGDGEGATTALSYRELRADIAIETGGVTAIFVRTRNSGFLGGKWRTHRAITGDGVVVKWEEQDLGIPTGADWLPREFVEWMRGGEP